MGGFGGRCAPVGGKNKLVVLDSSKEKSGSTIVTAYFDIKSKYSSSVYDTWMANMLSLQDLMII